MELSLVRATRIIHFLVVAAVYLISTLSVRAQTPPSPYALHIFARSTTQLDVSWTPSINSSVFDVYRDGTNVGTTTVPTFSDTGLTPGTAYSYTVVEKNSYGTSAPSGARVGTTRTLDGSFVMDGWPDFDGYRIQAGGSCDCGNVADLGIFAAVRGRTLYVAMRTIPPNGQYDYFLILANKDDDGFQHPAPWAKAGTVPAGPNILFIGAESTNNYVGWFNAPAGAQVVRAADRKGVIEGTIDLIDTYGYIPERIWIATLAYETGDGGHLVEQSPWGNKDDFVGSNEFRAPLVEAIRDEDQDGYWDYVDPAHGWRITSIVREADGTTTITAPKPAVTGSYIDLMISNVGPEGPYYSIGGESAYFDNATFSGNDRTGPAAKRWYRMQVTIY